MILVLRTTIKTIKENVKMTLTTLKKVINAVCNYCVDIDGLNTHEFEEISVEYSLNSNLHKSLTNGIKAPLNNGYDSIIFKPFNGNIAIYMPVIINNNCAGYYYLHTVDTALKTQIEVTAELMHTVMCLIEKYYK